jgi:hypothetical protein
VEELSVDSLENNKILFVTMVPMAPEKLIQHVLGVDKVLSLNVLKSFVIKFNKNIKVIKKLILEIADVIRFDASEVVMYQMYIFVMIGIVQLLQEDHNMLLCNFLEANLLRCVLITIQKMV